MKELKTLLPPKIKIRIKENGIKHYTNLESAEKVYSNKFIDIFHTTNTQSDNIRHSEERISF